MAFVLTAQLNLQAPTNTAAVAQQISRGLSGINAQINLTLSPQAQAALAAVNQQLSRLTAQTGSLQGVSASAAASVASIGRAAQGATASLATTGAALSTMARATTVMNAALGTSAGFFERLGVAAAAATQRFAAFVVGAGGLLLLVSGFREGLRAGVDFEKQMNRIEQVSGESSSALEVVRQRIGELSTGIGTSSAELSKSALILAQVGLSAKEVAKNLETLALASAAPNFDTMQQTAEGVIAVLRQFRTDADGTKEAIGAMNEVAAKFAVEAGDLVTAVRKSGGAFSAAGGDIKQLLALFTAVRSTTRESADEIATGLRTIFARTQRADVVEELKAFRINLRYTAEEARAIGDDRLTDLFVGPYEAVRRLSAAIKDLPSADPRFSSIVEALGGYRQISRVIPLLQQFGEAEKALAASQVGSLSLYRSAEKAQESLSTQAARTREQFLQLFRTLTESNAFKSFAEGALQLANSLATVLEYAKPLLPVLLSLATVSTIRAVGSFFFGAPGVSSPPAFTGRARPFNRGGPVGVVPGTGDYDSFPTTLPEGSFVIRKKSAQAIGYDNLTRMAGGGVPSLLTPGEAVVYPQGVRRMGGGLLDWVNRYAGGGPVRMEGGGHLLAPIGRGGLPFRSDVRGPRQYSRADEQTVRDFLRSLGQQHNLNLGRTYQAGVPLEYLFRRYPDLADSAGAFLPADAPGKPGLLSVSPNVLQLASQNKGYFKTTAAHEMGHAIDFYLADAFLSGGGAQHGPSPLAAYLNSYRRMVGRSLKESTLPPSAQSQDFLDYFHSQQETAADALAALLGGRVRIPGVGRDGRVGALDAPASYLGEGHPVQGLLRFGHSRVVPYLRSRLGPYDSYQAYARGGRVRPAFGDIVSGSAVTAENVLGVIGELQASTGIDFAKIIRPVAVGPYINRGFRDNDDLRNLFTTEHNPALGRFSTARPGDEDRRGIVQLSRFNIKKLDQLRYALAHELGHGIDVYLGGGSNNLTSDSKSLAARLGLNFAIYDRKREEGRGRKFTEDYASYRFSAREGFANFFAELSTGLELSGKKSRVVSPQFSSLIEEVARRTRSGLFMGQSFLPASGGYDPSQAYAGGGPVRLMNGGLPRDILPPDGGLLDADARLRQLILNIADNEWPNVLVNQRHLLGLHGLGPRSYRDTLAYAQSYRKQFSDAPELGMGAHGFFDPLSRRIVLNSGALTLSNQARYLQDVEGLLYRSLDHFPGMGSFTDHLPNSTFPSSVHYSALSRLENAAHVLLQPEEFSLALSSGITDLPGLLRRNDLTGSDLLGSLLDFRFGNRQVIESYQHINEYASESFVTRNTASLLAYDIDDILQAEIYRGRVPSAANYVQSLAGPNRDYVQGLLGRLSTPFRVAYAKGGPVRLNSGGPPRTGGSVAGYAQRNLSEMQKLLEHLGIPLPLDRGLRGLFVSAGTVVPDADGLMATQHALYRGNTPIVPGMELGPLGGGTGPGFTSDALLKQVFGYFGSGLIRSDSGTVRAGLSQLNALSMEQSVFFGPGTAIGSALVGAYPGLGNYMSPHPGLLHGRFAREAPTDLAMLIDAIQDMAPLGPPQLPDGTDALIRHYLERGQEFRRLRFRRGDLHVLEQGVRRNQGGPVRMADGGTVLRYMQARRQSAAGATGGPTYIDQLLKVFLQTQHGQSLLSLIPEATELGFGAQAITLNLPGKRVARLGALDPLNDPLFTQRPAIDGLLQALESHRSGPLGLEVLPWVDVFDNYVGRGTMPRDQLVMRAEHTVRNLAGQGYLALDAHLGNFGFHTDPRTGLKDTVLFDSGLTFPRDKVPAQYQGRAQKLLEYLGLNRGGPVRMAGGGPPRPLMAMLGRDYRAAEQVLLEEMRTQEWLYEPEILSGVHLLTPMQYSGFRKRLRGREFSHPGSSDYAPISTPGGLFDPLTRRLVLRAPQPRSGYEGLVLAARSGGVRALDTLLGGGSVFDLAAEKWSGFGGGHDYLHSIGMSLLGASRSLFEGLGGIELYRSVVGRHATFRDALAHYDLSGGDAFAHVVSRRAFRDVSDPVGKPFSAIPEHSRDLVSLLINLHGYRFQGRGPGAWDAPVPGAAEHLASLPPELRGLANTFSSLLPAALPFRRRAMFAGGGLASGPQHLNSGGLLADMLDNLKWVHRDWSWRHDPRGLGVVLSGIHLLDDRKFGLLNEYFDRELLSGLSVTPGKIGALDEFLVNSKTPFPANFYGLDFLGGKTIFDRASRRGFINTSTIIDPDDVHNVQRALLATATNAAVPGGLVARVADRDPIPLSSLQQKLQGNLLSSSALIGGLLERPEVAGQATSSLAGTYNLFHWPLELDPNDALFDFLDRLAANKLPRTARSPVFAAEPTFSPYNIASPVNTLQALFLDEHLPSGDFLDIQPTVGSHPAIQARLKDIHKLVGKPQLKFFAEGGSVEDVSVLIPALIRQLMEERERKQPLGRAPLGFVPGMGSQDTHPANLPQNSFVLKKSSTEKIGRQTLKALLEGRDQYASGGRARGVDALLTPGEAVFSPEAASKIGLHNLHFMNKTGEIPSTMKNERKYAEGGVVRLNSGGELSNEEIQRRLQELMSKKLGKDGVGIQDFLMKILGKGERTLAAAGLGVEDAAQESLLHIAKKLHTFDPANASFEAFVTQFARQKARDMIRKARGEVVAEKDEAGNVVGHRSRRAQVGSLTGDEGRQIDVAGRGLTPDEEAMRREALSPQNLLNVAQSATYRQLQQMASALGLDTKGKMPELQARVLAHLRGLAGGGATPLQTVLRAGGVGEFRRAPTPPPVTPTQEAPSRPSQTLILPNFVGRHPIQGGTPRIPFPVQPIPVGSPQGSLGGQDLRNYRRTQDAPEVLGGGGGRIPPTPPVLPTPPGDEPPRRGRPTLVKRRAFTRILAHQGSGPTVLSTDSLQQQEAAARLGQVGPSSDPFTLGSLIGRAEAASSNTGQPIPVVTPTPDRRPEIPPTTSLNPERTRLVAELRRQIAAGNVKALLLQKNRAALGEAQYHRLEEFRKQKVSPREDRGPTRTTIHMGGTIPQADALQARVLELAAQGLSPDEIAQRLGSVLPETHPGGPRALAAFRRRFVQDVLENQPGRRSGKIPSTPTSPLAQQTSSGPAEALNGPDPLSPLRPVASNLGTSEPIDRRSEALPGVLPVPPIPLPSLPQGRGGENLRQYRQPERGELNVEETPAQSRRRNTGIPRRPPAPDRDGRKRRTTLDPSRRLGPLEGGDFDLPMDDADYTRIPPVVDVDRRERRRQARRRRWESQLEQQYDRRAEESLPRRNVPVAPARQRPRLPTVSASSAEEALHFERARRGVDPQGQRGQRQTVHVETDPLAAQARLLDDLRSGRLSPADAAARLDQLESSGLLTRAQRARLQRQVDAADGRTGASSPAEAADRLRRRVNGQTGQGVNWGSGRTFLSPNEQDPEGLIYQRARQEAQANINRRARGGPVSQQTRNEELQAAYLRQRAAVEQELLSAQRRLLQQLYPGIGAVERERLAREAVERALRGEEAVIRDARGRLLGTAGAVNQAQQAGQTPPGAGGFWYNLQRGTAWVGRGLARVGRVGRYLDERLGLAGPGGAQASFAASFALPLVGEGVRSLGGDADVAVRSNNEFSYRAAQAGGGALTGAGVGALVGSFVPAIGTALGVLGGAALGAASSLRSASAEIGQVKIDHALQKFSDRLNALANLGNAAPAGYQQLALDELETFRRESARKSYDASGFFAFDFNRFVAQEEAGKRQNAGPLAANFYGVLNAEIGRILKESPDLTNRQVFGRLRENPLNQRILDDLSSLKGLPLDRLLQELAPQVTARRQSIRVEDETRRAASEDQSRVATFGRLTQAIQAAAESLNSLRLASQSAASAFEGDFTGPVQTTLSAAPLNRLGGPTGEALPLLELIRNVGPEGASLARTGFAVDSVRRELPAILAEVASRSRAADANAAESFQTGVNSLLRERLGGQADDPDIRQLRTLVSASLAQSLQGERGTVAVLDALSVDASNFADQLLQRATGPVVEAGKQIVEQRVAFANEYGQGLALGRRQSLVIGEGQDRVVELQTRLAQFEAEVQGERTGRRRGAVEDIPLATLLAPVEQRQRRFAVAGGLLPGDANNAGAIAGRLRDVTGRIGERQAEVDAAVRRGDSLESFRKASQELDNLKSQAQNLTLALRSLAEASRVAAIQQKLGEIRADKDSRLSAAERFLTSDYDQRVEFQRGLLLASTNRGRDLGNLQPADAALVVNSLRTLGSATLPGLEGTPAADDLLREYLEKSFGGIFKLAPGRAADEKSLQEQLLAAQREAVEAQKRVVEGQQALQQDFYANLLQIQTRFFAELKLSLTREGIRPLENELVSRNRDLGRLTEQREQRDYLGRFGINSQGRYEAVVNNRDILEEYRTNLVKAEDTRSGFQDAERQLIRRTQEFRERARREGHDRLPPGILADTVASRLRDEFLPLATTGRGPQGAQVINELLARLTPEQRVAVENQYRTNINSTLGGNGGGTLEARSRALYDAIQTVGQNQLAPLVGQRNALETRIGDRLPGLNQEELRRALTYDSDSFFRALESLKGVKFEDLDEKIQTVNRSLDELNIRINNAYREAGLQRPPRTDFGRGVVQVGSAISSAAGGIDSFLKAIQAIALAQQGVQAVQNFAGGLGVPNGLFQAFGFASGGIAGLNFGPPRGSDVIPSMLTPGEAVVPAASTRANRPLVDALIRANGPLYMAGGGIATMAALLGRNFQFLSDVAGSKDLPDFLHRLGIEPGPLPLPGFPVARPRGAEPIGEAPGLIAPPFRGLVDNGERLLRGKNDELRLRARIDPFSRPGLLVRGRALGLDPDGPDRAAFARANQLESLRLLRLRQLNAQSRDPFAAFGLAQADSQTQRSLYDRALVSRQAANQRALLSDPFARFADQEFKARFTQNQRFGLRPPIGAYEARRPGLLYGYLQGFRGFAEGGLVPSGMEHPSLQGWRDATIARLESGEFVLPRSSVARLGLPFLESLRKFAQGGLVGGAPSPVPAGATGPGLAPEVVQAFQKSATLVQDSMKLFQASVGSLTTAFNAFNSASSTLVEALNNFSGSLSITGTQRVEVVVNGAEALTRITPEIARMVQDMVRQQLLRVFREHLPDIQVRLD